MADPGHIGGPIVIPNGVQVILNWTLPDAKLAHNVLYGSVGGAFTATAAVAEAIRSGLVGSATWTTLAGFMMAGASLTGVSLLDVRTASNAKVTSTGAASPGTSASLAMPDECAVCVTLRTALTGQANRGRIYIPGFASNAMGAAGVIAATCVSAVANWAAIIPTQLTAQGITLSIGHPARAAYTGRTGTLHPARAAGLVPVTQLVVRDNHWDTQRRRGLR